MKKFLLSLAAFALAASVSAESYTVFDIANPGEWTGDGNGWKSTTVAGGKTFNLSTNKAESSTDLISPVANSYAWRVYKKSQVKIESPDMVMKQIIITYDDYESGKYCVSMTLSSGWTGILDGATYTLTSDGKNEITMTADNGQARIKTIVVSDEAGEIDPPIGPDLPDDVVYKNDFSDNLDGWTIINDDTLSDFLGWKIQNKENSPKCAICNSYYSGENHPADSKMQYQLDLTDREDCEFSFSQAFGFDFPQKQVDNYRVYVVNGDNVDYLNMANFPEAPASGKNWSSWVVNSFDISEYDGCVISIGFEYLTDGSISRVWELQDFVVKGNKTGSVETIAADNGVATYYNLQGARVNNPEKGLFIVVKGGKSQKVIF